MLCEQAPTRGLTPCPLNAGSGGMVGGWVGYPCAAHGVEQWPLLGSRPDAIQIEGSDALGVHRGVRRAH